MFDERQTSTHDNKLFLSADLSPEEDNKTTKTTHIQRHKTKDIDIE